MKITKNNQNNVEKNNKVGGCNSSDFKTYCEARIIISAVMA